MSLLACSLVQACVFLLCVLLVLRRQTSRLCFYILSGGGGWLGHVRLQAPQGQFACWVSAKAFDFRLLQGENDRLLESWEDEFLSPSGRFPVLEDRNSWYKCPEFVDVILMGGHLFCLQNWHFLWALRNRSLLHLPRRWPCLCREVADPSLLSDLAMTVTIWGSALKCEGGWDTSDLCGNSRRVIEFPDQQWQTGRPAF